ncbi:hypothetical protein RUL20_002011 [Vibrio parahaemolyticus]|nr:hypothetical protein [Vibrio parahaemolyticus]ELJ8844811.1 hypothetical protein [Vibrio parahaemolyticus]MBE4516592.1 hypothetical protein [Vibrio parahaemolyticus]
MKKLFACAVDAEQAMSDFASQCHFLGFTQPTIVKELIYSGRGRPKKDAKPSRMPPRSGRCTSETGDKP